jgi:hypothetical protein
MNEISNKQTANIFIIGLSYVFPGDIDTESMGASRVSVSLAAGKSWIPLYFTPGSAKLLITENNSFEGNSFTTDLECSLPGSNEDFDKSVRAICEKPIVLQIILSNSDVLMLGGKKKKVRIKLKQSIDIKAGYQLLVSYTSKDMPKNLI